MATDVLLGKVCRALDGLVRAAEPYDGLFPSMLTRDTGEMLTELPAAIAGQRDGDRAFLGSNLVHDEPTLLTMFALAEALGRPDYAAAADRYLARFAIHCTRTATGLFPWGEHAYWHLAEDRVGSSLALHNPQWEGRAIHDHLRQAPLWLWQKIQDVAPDAVQRFAVGLDGHWAEGEPDDYTGR